MTRVTRSVAFDHLRKERRRRRAREQKAAEVRRDVVDESRSDLFERIEWLRSEMRGLDRVSAEIIELRYRGGLTLEAIGRRLGLGTGAVHGRLTRTIARLQKKRRWR
ncbi:MAG: sigma-70 family RNA polymerase sigma factor [Planctomycetes bacterium]|nr:sigma-70 family RNA polymerase sigma factor [Planctomycetota bacterium]